MNSTDEIDEVNDAAAQEDELELLKQRARLMGIKFHPTIGLDKLKEKLEGETTEELATGPIKESKAKRNARLRKEANKLVRIRLTNMDPSRKNWPGEIISISNSAIGVIKKMIPYNAEEGYHVPQVLLDILREKKFQQFYTVTIDGKKIKRTRQAKSFAIEILPDLTIDELKELAAKQALNHTVDA